MAVEGGGGGQDPDKVDDRFAELILAEFGERSAQDASTPAPPEPRPDAPQRERPTESQTRDPGDHTPTVFSFDEALERLEPDEPEPYTPETLPPMRAPSSMVIVSLVLLLGGLLAGLVLGTRQQLAGLPAALVAVSIVSGLALLMGLAVRRRGPEDPDDDGARL